MRHVDIIVIPARSEVILKPRSYHIMLIDLVSDLTMDKNTKVKLKFKNASEVEVKAPVKDIIANKK